MPELPEVETICRGLAPHLLQAGIVRIILRRAALRVPLPKNLKSSLNARTLQNITRRAKYIRFHFDDDQVLIIHLGMSGRILLHKSLPERYSKHDHVIMHWDNGCALVFNDARRFGLMALSTESELIRHPLFKDLGPEPLHSKWNGRVLYGALQASAAPVKSVIMDQRKLVGVGNIYACEALFDARLHPSRPARSLSREEAVQLGISIRKVLKEAIASGGSTLRDYVRSSGETGYFQHHFQVYGRQKQLCSVCRYPIRIMRQSGRSTFFCEHCQN